MSLVRLEQISKSYAPYLVLDDISASIERGDRIGLIGKNGSGKTTLTEIIAGKIQEFEGSVYTSRGLRIGYQSQEPKLNPTHTLRQEVLEVFRIQQTLEDEMLRLSERMEQEENQALLEEYANLQEQHECMGGYDYEHQISRTLSGLGFGANDFHLGTGALSGGQKSRAALAKLLLEEPDLLLLDEPTNHLDIKAIEWLENYLNSEYEGAVLIASHDRYFLDRVARKIWELRNHQIKSYRGNYSKYVETNRLEILAQERNYAKQQRFIAHEEEFIRRNIAGQRTREAQGRQKLLNRIERVEKPDQEPRSMSIRFTPDARGGNDILRCQELEMRYDDNIVFRSLNLEVYRRDVIGIIGPNGAGKTTLLRLILGELEASDGDLKIGANLSFGYYDQELEGLNLGNEILDEISELRPKHTQEEIRNFLGRFLFSGDEVFKKIRNLSGGEQSRVMLAKLLLENANVLLLDEPTNHLDIPSREALEKALSEYAATTFIISHDRYLMNKLATKLLVFENGTANLFVGTYAEYEDHLREEKQTAINDLSTSSNAKKKTTVQEGKSERVRIAPTPKKSSKSKRRRVKAERLIDV
ncbi:MAG: ABC-F family ATP-binding cassette domain-containing protein [Candidatus Poribacteria bacterium]|nr:ABC-F family ATP-binding cassette domain-containing protein [Candidatus Poribacteria bacterium]